MAGRSLADRTSGTLLGPLPSHGLAGQPDQGRAAGPFGIGPCSSSQAKGGPRGGGGASRHENPGSSPCFFGLQPTWGSRWYLRGHWYLGLKRTGRKRLFEGLSLGSRGAAQGRGQHAECTAAGAEGEEGTPGRGSVCKGRETGGGLMPRSPNPCLVGVPGQMETDRRHCPGSFPPGWVKAGFLARVGGTG